MKQKNILIYIGIIAIVLIIYFFLSSNSLSNPMKKSEAINLELIADNFVSPTKLIESPDNSGRLFVADQTGVIKIIKNGQVLDEAFLDLKKNMVELKESYDERGLLGIAFSPNFENDKKFYVYYSAPLRKNGPQGWDHTSRVSEFKISNDNQDKVDLNSEKIILEIDEPQFNHNGGEIIFGSDGYLYVAVGDGGNADDFGLGHSKIGNAQDLSNLLGKILRIQTDGGIPSDNPFVGKTGRDEIYAYGFRNPFRMSFDKKTGRLFVGDVGQNLWEEVDIVEKGKNYGWNIKEGTHCFSHESPDQSPANCNNVGYQGEQLMAPILEYNHSEGISVIGGFIYRGTEIPGLNGKYIFGDWSDNFKTGGGKVMMAEEKENKWNITETIKTNSFIQGFGENKKGELYVLTTDQLGTENNIGKAYKIVK